MARKEWKPVRLAWAFGMIRTAAGYITKESLVFTLSDDTRKNKKTIDDFAKKNNLAMVEVWYRYDNEWDKVIHYKTYTYLPTITGEQLDKMKP